MTAVLALAICLCPFYATAQGKVVITSKLDSAYLLMGRTTTLHVELTKDNGADGYFAPRVSPLAVDGKIYDPLTVGGTNSAEIAEHVEVVSITVDSASIGNNRTQINRDLVLQSFDSGVYIIPEQLYIIGADTFRSNPVTLKVLPVDVDSLATVHDYKTIESVPFKLLDYVPSFIVNYWWIILLIILLAAIALALYFSKDIKSIVKPEKIIPPYDEAVERLRLLKERQLWQSGQEKEYYTELTDILRNYIFRRFGINAMEMTSSQIIAVLKKNEETRAVNEQLNMILEVADFVKFAKLRPLPDDNERSYARALNFVNETKPVEEVPQEGEEAEEAESAKTHAASPGKGKRFGFNLTKRGKQEEKND